MTKSMIFPVSVGLSGLGRIAGGNEGLAQESRSGWSAASSPNAPARFNRRRLDIPSLCIALRGYSESCQSANLRSRNALAITETELNVIAALAIMGLRRTPRNG